MDEKECKDINNKALEEIENIFKVIQYRINIKIYINECNKQTKDMDEDSINKFYDNDSFRSLVDNSKEILNNDSIRILVDNSNEILNNQYNVKIVEKIYHIIENFVYYKKLEQTNSNDFNLKKEIISQKMLLINRINEEKKEIKIIYFILLYKNHENIFNILVNDDNRLLELNNYEEIKSKFIELNESSNSIIEIIKNVKGEEEITFEETTNNNEDENKTNNNQGFGIGEGIATTTGVTGGIYFTAASRELFFNQWRKFFDYLCKFKIMRGLYRLDNSLQFVIDWITSLIGVSTFPIGNIIPFIGFVFSLISFIKFSTTCYKYTKSRNFNIIIISKDIVENSREACKKAVKIINEITVKMLLEKEKDSGNRLIVKIGKEERIINNNYINDIKNSIEKVNECNDEICIITENLICILYKIENLLNKINY